MALQQNNQGPVGWGQPNRGMRRRLMREEDEQMFGRSPEVEDAQPVQFDPSLGTGQPPSIYPPQQPQRPQGGYQNQAVPGRTPLGENDYSRAAYQTRTDDPFTAGIRNAMATPAGVPNYRPGSVDPRDADPRSGYGYGGVQNPLYQAQQSSQPQGQPQGQQPGSLADAAAQAAANGWTDIAGTKGFKTGNFMGSLEGFNTGAWGTDERGSDTLKNTFGKIASRYDPTQAGAAQQVLNDPDFKSLWPNATIVEHPNQDLIDFDGPGGEAPVDVLRAAQAGGSGAAWQWGTNPGQGPQQGPAYGPGGPSAQAYMQGLPQAQPLNSSGVPEVRDSGSAADFLQWLMQQQQQGQMPQY